MDLLNFIIAVETDPDSLSIEEYVDGMAELVKTGMAWQLQGSWGRAALALIEGGIINKYGEVIEYPVPA